MNITRFVSSLQFGQIKAFTQPQFGNDDADTDLASGDKVTSTPTNDVLELAGADSTDELTADATDEASEVNGDGNPLDEVMDNLRASAHPYAQKAASALVGVLKIIAGVAEVISNLLSKLAKFITGDDPNKMKALLLKWSGTTEQEAQKAAVESMQEQIIELHKAFEMDPTQMLAKLEKQIKIAETLSKLNLSNEQLNGFEPVEGYIGIYCQSGSEEIYTLGADIGLDEQKHLKLIDKKNQFIDPETLKITNLPGAYL